MLFSSLEFIFLFLPICTAVYFLSPLRIRNLVLLLFSLIFYGFGEPLYVFLMLFTIAADHIFGLLVQKHREDKKRAKRMLSLAILFNLGILAYFKYFSFFLEILSAIFNRSLPIRAPQSLPIGISFYTFQAMSYVIDVYRQEVNAEKSPVVTGTYVILFPQLVAGPIIRYKDIAAQLKERRHTISKAASGIRRFSIGLAKKCILANSAGEIWSGFCTDISNGAPISTLGAWLALTAFAFQIYFDFSGYSDMAIGLGRIFGFEFPENFNYPYASKSITDFWRRWHITLSSYFREYVYIPLGGNRCGKLKMYLSLFAVWSLTGLWHGASFNFLLWGVYYFILLLIEKSFLLRALERTPTVFRRAYTLLFIALGWLIFSADGVALSMSGVIECFGTLFSLGDTPLFTQRALYETRRHLFFFLIMAVASTPLPKNILDRAEVRLPKITLAFENVLALSSILLSTAYLVNSGYNPFLYFRF